MFDYRAPGVIRFGAGAWETVGNEVAALNAGRVLLVCDPGIVRLGITDRVRNRLTGAGLMVTVYDGVIPEPLDTNVTEGLALFNDNHCNAVVAVGGGSSIDVAKAVAIMSRNPGQISKYAVGGEPFSRPKAPVVAIPTTAGTGSEVTRSTIITDTARGVKMLINHPYITPDVALVDPSLTATMSPALTMATGIDALVHAMEAYLSVKASPISDLLALRAISLIGANLRPAWSNGGNATAREAMMLGAMMAGLAFSNSSVALVHGMARPIGAHFHVPHGLSNAVLLSECMSFTMLGAPARMAEIAGALGEAVEDLSVMEAAHAGVVAIAELCADLEVPRLCGLGITAEALEERAPRMAAEALASGSPGNNPRLASAEQIVDLYRHCL
jgi:alcohol dehydrogenase class IV